MDNTAPFQGWKQHPDWSLHSTIYEVNLRQYSAEGTFKAFGQALPRLKNMGVEILWIMPIQPIGILDRKGSMGSYYSIRDYTAVNEEFGSLEDFKELVHTAQGMGFKVILDWVANHTAPDHVWTTQHPDYYVRNDQGHFMPVSSDMTDIIRLNYDHPEMENAMIEAMKFWMVETGLDGFRCDLADWVRLSFWLKVRPALETIRPVFMLAEAEKPEMHQAFDATYTWSVFHTLNDIARGYKHIGDLDGVLGQNAANFPPEAIRMYFTTNHDENSWNGTEYEMMGAGATTFAVLTFTLPGMPLIYSGQEAANHKRLLFFDKDPIVWDNYPLAGFYQTLGRLKGENPALVAGHGSAYSRIRTNRDDVVFAFFRQKDQYQVVVLLNLSGGSLQMTWGDPAVSGQYREVFTGSTMTLVGENTLQMQPWGFLVLEQIG
ncbi:MAG: alpha-amylase family glycosyl hydrolase [Chitinophagaceae bacterium]